MHPIYLANIGSQCLSTAQYQNTEVSQQKGIQMLIFHSDSSVSDSNPERWHSWALGGWKKPEYSIAKTSDSQQISVAHKQLGSAQPQLCLHTLNPWQCQEIQRSFNSSERAQAMPIYISSCCLFGFLTYSQIL